MNLHKPVLFLALILLFSTKLNAQEDATGRIPEYPVPYEFPTVDGIKDVLNSVRGYYESTSPQKIIDAGTEMIRLLQNDKIEIQTARINSRNSTFHFRLKSEWPEK
jgi:hypothetical protein